MFYRSDTHSHRNCSFNLTDLIICYNCPVTHGTYSYLFIHSTHDHWALSHFWATVCKTVCPMLSDRCPSVCPVCGLSVCPVCNVGVLWPNGWTDQDATWYGGRPRPKRHCVRWGPHITVASFLLHVVTSLQASICLHGLGTWQEVWGTEVPQRGSGADPW